MRFRCFVRPETPNASVPEISIVIPVYNEEAILAEAVSELSSELDALGWNYELVLAENGSTDGTVALARTLAAECQRVEMFCVDEPNYGKALRHGILGARGRWVICDEIDLCDTDFHQRAIKLLMAGGCEMVVGSKAMKGAADSRPLFRRFATRVINRMLRVAVDFRGTDTHGLKAFDRDRLTPIVSQCIIDRDLFASELVVRAGRAGIDVVEIPVRVSEKRRPAINVIRRVPNVLRNLAQLTYAIRIKG